jgi:hypothetical protein
VQAWHYNLRKQPTTINDINALRAQWSVYCSSRAIESLRIPESGKI